MSNVKCYTSGSHQVSVSVSRPTEKLSRRKGTRKSSLSKNLGKDFQQFLASTLFVLLFINAILSVKNLLANQSQNIVENHATHDFNYHPELDEHELSYSTWYLPYIHIVNTRFMQNEARLQYLAQARLNLFETFCLPSMILQKRQHDFSSEYDDIINAFIIDEFNQMNRTNLKNEYNKMDTKEKAQIKKILKMQNFLWIIKTDPLLPSEWIQRLQKLLRPYPNFYLVGSNTNFGVGSKHGSWRDGAAGNDLMLAANYSNEKHFDEKSTSRIYTGDLMLLKLAHQYREDRIIIETRLDADDGLHQNYLSSIQNNAMDKFGLDVVQKKESKSYQNNKPKSENIKWLYWCASNHIEWFSDSSPSSATTNTKKKSLNINRAGNIQFQSTGKNLSVAEAVIINQSDFGTLYIPRNEGECITPGISLAITIGIEEEEIQRYPHNKLVQMVWKEGNCGTKNPKQCLQFLQNLNDKVSNHTVAKQLVHEDNRSLSSSFMAIRARTPTSAGMKDVQIRSNHESSTDIYDQNQIQKIRWQRLHLDFGISAEMAKSSNKYVKEHMREIAIDNIKGQGTKGHSSKISSKDKLQSMVDVLEGNELLADNTSRLL